MKDDIIILCRAARKARSMKQPELSARCGIHTSTLSQFENGRLFSWDIAQAYYINVLNEAERNTFDVLKEREINGR